MNLITHINIMRVHKLRLSAKSNTTQTKFVLKQTIYFDELSFFIKYIKLFSYLIIVSYKRTKTYPSYADKFLYLADTFSRNFGRSTKFSVELFMFED